MLKWLGRRARITRLSDVKHALQSGRVTFVELRNAMRAHLQETYDPSNFRGMSKDEVSRLFFGQLLDSALKPPVKEVKARADHFFKGTSSALKKSANELSAGLLHSFYESSLEARSSKGEFPDIITTKDGIVAADVCKAISQIVSGIETPSDASKLYAD